MSVLHINNNNFEQEIIKSEKPVLVDFFASWCGPCKMLSPVIESFANEFPQYKVCKINVDEEPELAQKYGVMSIPTLIVIKDGEAASKAVGYRRKEQLLELLEG